MLVRLRRLELAGFALRQPGNIWSHPHFWLNRISAVPLVAS